MHEKITVAACKASRTGTACINPAVAACCDAFLNNFRSARATVESDFEAGLFATAAYQASLPPLTGSDNIRDFVACVSYGMLLTIIDGDDGTRFLYAA